MLSFTTEIFHKRPPPRPLEGGLPPEELEEFDVSYAFICSLQLDEEDLHPDLEH